MALGWRKTSREREFVDNHGLQCFLSMGSAGQPAPHKGERELRDEQEY